MIYFLIMKKTFKNSLKKLGMLCVIMIFFGCDLDNQKKAENPKADLGPDAPFSELSVWDWIQTQKTPNGAVFNVDKFDFLIKAIEVTGLQEEFKYAGKDRTYFLLNNDAFTATSNGLNGSVAPNYATVANIPILRLVVPSMTILPNDKLKTFDFSTLDANQKNKLRDILKYHIVTSYIDQENVLVEKTFNYRFKTRLEGEKGIVFVSRVLRLDIVLNGIPADVQGSVRPLAGAKFSIVRNHNYIFKNGIAHHLARNTFLTPF
jgi:uncharacterized surface protein with fasciclin (FAS1) repeats